MALSTENAIEVKDVSKSFRVYKDKSSTLKDRILFSKRNRYSVNVVLDDISFSVRKGEALGLIGHNGCGKSTTLKLLNKIIYPDAGSIQMNGKISSLIELGAGFHPDMTGRENIYINASIFGLNKKEIDARLDTIIRFSELEDFIDNPVRTYSSGMYMRLAFAIAINVDADILLVDEILAVGDAGFQKKCFDRLHQIKEQGATIVIVSHSMDQIKSICDRVLWLEKGKIREDGPAGIVCNDYMIFMSDATSRRTQKELVEEGLSKVDDPNKIYPIRNVSPQFAAESRRFGSMAVRFCYLEMLNDEGEACQHFHYQDPLILRYTVEKGEEAPDRFHIVFNIVKSGGDLVSTFTGPVLTWGERNGNTKISGQLRIDSLYMAEGDYHIDAFVFDEKGHMMDFLTWIILFGIRTPKMYGTGVLAMDNEWE